ncbi:MAG: AAA family ATPase [Phycisphaerae bacterium]|jgi:DNA repair exonuclease SbcCD ATPase subunit
MKQVIFNRLSVQDFKGVNKKEIELSDGVNVIYGANRTGKTSLLDALYWVLFGKSLLGDTRFGIMPINKLSAVPCVELRLEIDAVPRTLTRKLKDGGATDCMIDGVPIKVRDYEQWVENNVMPIDRFKLFSNPLYFSGLGWQEQRQLFTSFFENPDAADVLVVMEREGVKPSAGFLELIGKMKPEDIQAKMKVEITELDTQKTKDQAVADHLTAEIAKSEAVSVPELETERAKLAQEWDEATERAKRQEAAREEVSAAVCKRSNLRQDAEDVQQKIRRFNEDNSADAAAIKARMVAKKEHKQKLADEWKRANVEVIKTTCPTCGQALSADVVNCGETLKANRLKDIEERGKKCNDELAEFQAELDKIAERKCPELETEYAEKKAEFEKQQGIVDNLDAKIDAPVESIGTLRARLDEIGKLIAESGKVDDKKTERAELVATIAKTAREIEIRERVQKDAGQYILYSAQAAVEAVNAQFSQVKIELFDYQKNGVVKPTFKLLFNGVDFGDTSSTERVLIGLEINAYLKTALGASVPTIIDNFESYKSIPFTDLPRQSIVSAVSDTEDINIMNIGG